MVLYVSAIANVMKTAMINWKRTTYFIRGRALTWKLGGGHERVGARRFVVCIPKKILFSEILGGQGNGKLEKNNILLNSSPNTKLLQSCRFESYFQILLLCYHSLYECLLNKTIKMLS